jgi:adenylate cyclase
LKREIAYHGDVINTAARLQAKCNDLGKTLLISSAIYQNLPTLPFKVEDMGSVALRGKQQPIKIYALESTEDVAKIREG